MNLASASLDQIEGLMLDTVQMKDSIPSVLSKRHNRANADGVMVWPTFSRLGVGAVVKLDGRLII